MPKLRSWFLRLCAIIFLVSCLGKLLAVIEGLPHLLEMDEVLPVPKRVLLTAAVVVEAMAAIVLLRGMLSERSRLLLVAWVASIFVAYRFIRLLTGAVLPCDCIGAFTRYMPFSARFTSAGFSVIAVGMLLGSIALFAYTSVAGRSSAPSDRNE